MATTLPCSAILIAAIEGNALPSKCSGTVALPPNPAPTDPKTRPLAAAAMLTVAGNEWQPQHPDRLYPGDEEQLLADKGAAGGFIVAGHHAPLAPLFVLLVLFLADLAPPFSFFIHLGLLPLTGLLPATALLAASAALLFLLIALLGHQITPCFAIKK